MTLRERILAVYRGETPDVVPYMLDLSHWFFHRHGLPFDFTSSNTEPEHDLIAYHKAKGVGYYVPNRPEFLSASYGDDVVAGIDKVVTGDRTEIIWRLETPLGVIERRRTWNQRTYSWHISRWGVKTEQDLRVLGYALGSVTWHPAWENYRSWDECVGEVGVTYLFTGYSAMGHLMNLWMGVEGVVYAAADWPDTMRETVDRINEAALRAVDLAADSPAHVTCMGDNFSSDTQPPHFFRRWSRDYYATAIERLHAAGKPVAVHVDGRMKGLLAEMTDIGVDCIDAVTPPPMGDITPQQCRDEAGPDMILSGGVSPNVWLPEVDTETFRRAVGDWLELRRRSPRLILAAGDQVPPGAVEDRIEIARDMVEEYGRY